MSRNLLPWVWMDTTRARYTELVEGLTQNPDTCKGCKGHCTVIHRLMHENLLPEYDHCIFLYVKNGQYKGWYFSKEVKEAYVDMLSPEESPEHGLGYRCREREFYDLFDERIIAWCYADIPEIPKH